MKEVIINEPSLFQVLVSSPTTYIVLAIIALTIVELKRSTNCFKANKTSSPSKPKRARGKKGKYLADDPTTPNKNEAWEGGKAPKKKAKKKTATKKAVKKRTPKKGGK